MPIRSEALPYVLPGALLAGVAAGAGLLPVALLVLVATAGMGAFFRDPDRAADAAPGAVLSPADGRVVEVASTPDGVEVAIFLSVFNVHVTRAPLSGQVVQWDRIDGGHAMAFRERASQNARHRVLIAASAGNVELSLIAGAVARRVVPFVSAPATVERGERIALIKFGSRAELSLPAGYVAMVSVGDAVRAGRTTIARIAPQDSSA